VVDNTIFTNTNLFVSNLGYVPSEILRYLDPSIEYLKIERVDENNNLPKMLANTKNLRLKRLTVGVKLLIVTLIPTVTQVHPLKTRLPPSLIVIVLASLVKNPSMLRVIQVQQQFPVMLRVQSQQQSLIPRRVTFLVQVKTVVKHS